MARVGKLLLGVLLLLASIPVGAAEDLAALRARVAAARRGASALLAEQASLADEIAPLKRSAKVAELRPLLVRSVELEARVRAAVAHRRGAERSFAEALRDRIAAIDRELELGAPRLSQGSLDSRKKAARALQSLRMERQRLREELGAVLPEASDERWARFSVEVDPLDGPAELEEKADFAEDARDKLKARRLAVLRLAESAAQSRRIEQASRALSAEGRLFDDEIRPGRVSRGSGGGVSVAAEAPRAGPEAGVDNSAAPSFGSADPGRATPPPEASPPPLAARELSPLLALDPARLDPADLDPADLDRLLEQLEAAERALDRSAEALRARARELEAR